MIIILNGPPGCGKDTIADKFNQYPHFRFKDVLYTWAAKMCSMPRETFIQLASSRETKEVPHYMLPTNFNTGFYFTPRQWLIHCSENIIKPLKGPQFFGRELANTLDDLEHESNAVIVSDGGFEQELEALRWLDLLLIVRIHRPGYDFSGDSRTYLNGTDADVVVDLYNDSDLESLFERFEAIVTETIKEVEAC